MPGESVNRRGVSPQMLPHRSLIDNAGFRHLHPESRREEWHVMTTDFLIGSQFEGVMTY
jgi:hypothetical protein